jgi:hypothetical protein
MLLSAVSVLVVAQSILEFLEGITNYRVLQDRMFDKKKVTEEICATVGFYAA